MTFKINQSIDVSFLKTLPTLDQIPLQIAQCNQNTLLEVSDFSTCQSQLPAEAKGADTSKAFTAYRENVITALVKSKAVELKTQFPKLDVNKFAALVVKLSPGVVAISPMLDRLISGMNGLKDINEKGILVFATAWMSVYAFGEINNDWVKKGGKPLLPGNEVDAFVNTTLANLEQGKIKFGIMNRTVNDEYLKPEARYNFTDNTLEVPFEQILDPMLIGTGDVATVPLLVHELYHSYQDSRNIPMSRIESESSARLLHTKLELVMGDRNAISERERLIAEENWKATTDSQVALKDRDYPIKFFIDYMIENPLGKRVTYFYPETIALAIKELETGTIDLTARADHQKLYAAYELIGVLSALFSTRQAQAEQSPDAAKQEIANNVKDLPNPIPFTSANNANELNGYLMAQIDRTMNIYYTQGKTKSREYFTNTFMVEFEKKLLPAYMKIPMAIDGF